MSIKQLTDEVAAREKRLRPLRLPLHDAPKLRPPDAAAVVVHGADETAVAALDGDADGRPRGRPSADDAAVVAAAATRTSPDDKRLPFPAFCRWLRITAIARRRQPLLLSLGLR